MKKLLSVFIVLVILSGAKFAMPPGLAHAQAITQADTNKGLIGWWKCIGDSSATSSLPTTGTTVYDSSGHGITGIYSGTKAGSVSSTYYSTGANVGPYACNFDGSTNYIDMGTSYSPFSLTGGGTITAWVNPSSSGSNNNLINKGSDYPTGQTYGLAIASGTTTHNTTFWMFASNSPYHFWSLSSTSSILTGSWSFIAVKATCLNSTSCIVTLYVNGSPAGSGAIGYAFTSIASLSFRVGQQNRSGYPYPYRGLINDIRCFNVPLTNSQIAQMYLAHN
jgi:hypothetical protein